MKKYVLILAAALAAAFFSQSNKAQQETDDASKETVENNSSIGVESDGTKTQGESKARYEMPAALTDRPEQIIEHKGFVLSYNNKHNTPNWSAWKLTAKHSEGDIPRSTKFWADPSVPTPYRVDYYEYKGSGYDRGHMCPASDNKWNKDAMHDCFYMSNMCPQDPSLNSGSWKQLEEACRRWVKTEGSLYIVCGPLYRGKTHEKIGIDHSIDVPEAFFKAVLSLRKGHEKAIGFIYENNDDNQPMNQTAMTVDEVEKKIKMDLFHDLDDELEDRLESAFSLQSWK